MSHFNPPRVGPYLLLDPLEGTTLRLRRARDAGGRHLVFKLHAAGTEDVLGMAETVLWGFRHPGIAACVDAGRHPASGELFTVTDEVRGVPLAPGSLGPELVEPGRRRLLVARLLSAVGAIHATGLLHRDLKDANVLLEQQEGRPVVIDFGLACPESGAADHALAGTPRTMAPELFAGEPASRATDLWSVGLLLSEALLGRRLFVGRDPTAMAAERRAFTGFTDEDAGRLGEPALVALLERLLDPDPAARPPDALAAMAALPVHDEREARALADDELNARLWTARAAVDPCRARRAAALRDRSVSIHLAPDGPFDPDSARDALLGYAAALPVPDDALRARLAEGASFPATAEEIALLAGALAEIRPLVVAVGPADDRDVQRTGVLDALRAVPRVTVFEEPAPTAREACAVTRAWLGGRALLEERLTASPPARWQELGQALAELVRLRVVRLGPGGLDYDESRLTAGWPLSGDSDPAAGISPAGRDLLAVLASSPWSLRRSTLRALLGPDVDDALAETRAHGLTLQTASYP
jgi:hypothetical protein